jgi:hypothetical protein
MSTKDTPQQRPTEAVAAEPSLVMQLIVNEELVKVGQIRAQHGVLSSAVHLCTGLLGHAFCYLCPWCRIHSGQWDL